MKNKIIYLLIGPKGSGKSYIGSLMEKQFDIKFVRVEDWVKKVKKGRQIDDETYLSDAFKCIENSVRTVLNHNSKIVFESTGLTVYFDQMLSRFREDFKVVTIKIQADIALCLKRVKTRDQSIHINVSDDQVNLLNKQVQAKNIITDHIINNNSKNINELTSEIGIIIKTETQNENPWLNIKFSEYENHMLEVGQAQVLNNLTEEYLKEYKPEYFALIGCSTGNGLEHIDNNITKKVFAIDINPDYLKQTKIRFENKINNITTCCIDLQNEELNLSNIDLAFCGLILEYVDPEILLKKITKTLNKNGKIVLIIQKNKNTSFVSKTKYTSLESLSSIAKEISENTVAIICKKLHLKLIQKKEIQLNEKKSFLVFVYNNPSKY
ncbi:MAG: methyltransferase domain-containing protein [Bacteroidia bacterium]|nr:methyltransferase domain-containing protein [Bacteroidia bacterium]